MSNILDEIQKLAKNVGDQILGFYKTRMVQANLKSDNTVVTEADYFADQQIRSYLEKHFPKDGIISEEKNTIFPKDKEFVWVIDPLDGTTNFSQGLHYWGISIARLKNGRPNLAVLYFPMLEELIVATKGGGAFLNGNQLQVRKQILHPASSFFSCCSRTYQHYSIDIPFKTRILGSGVYGLCTVALGIAVIAFEATPKIWDFSGSWLVIEEAGGTILLLDGKSPFPLIPGINYQTINFPMLAAVSQKQWNLAQTKIKRK